MLGHCARACDQDVNEAAGAGLPAGESRGVEDAHERTHEVDGVGIGAEITAGDGVLDGGHEGGVNERPGALRVGRMEPPVTVSIAGRISCLREMCSIKSSIQARRGLNRLHGGGKALFGGGKPFDFTSVDGLDQSGASCEMTIERGVADS